jgi:hypothetical protein
VGKGSGWLAICTLAGHEFTAHVEITRFSLTCFLPARRVPVRVKGYSQPFLRAVPLIPRHLLMPPADARRCEIHCCPGVKKGRYLAQGADGRPLIIPPEAIRALARLDCDGAFDAPLPHNMVRLPTPELIAAMLGDESAASFAPLFAPLAPAA